MSMLNSPPAALGPNVELPEGLKQWRILLLVTSMNSFAQKVRTYLQNRGIGQMTVHMMGDDDGEVARIAEDWKVDVILCPFLTKRIPAEVYNRWMTLVVHPGPPGDAGPSSLDWVLIGDTGLHSSSTDPLTSLVSAPSSHPPKQRPYWGTIVFQANAHLDGGSIWAWEQYKLPSIGSITKAGLYQGEHSRAAILSVMTALIRVYETVVAGGEVRPKQEWSERSIALRCGFLGGPTHDRPLLQSRQRKLDWGMHTADDVLRIISAGDSQPGAQISPLTGHSKTSLFVYGGHLHVDVGKIPKELYEGEWDAIPNGTPVVQRSGAVLFKTTKGGKGCAIWITHGRVPKKAGSPLEPKIPLAQAIIASGHGSILGDVREWDLGNGFEAEQGVWKEVYVKSVDGGDRGVAQLVYWEFYNGAFSTTQCQLLLRGLQWAVAPERGNVTMLVLMGGHYFSNGIALNTIEAHASPPNETWANINAIDDIVEFLISDVASERSPFMSGQTPLCERGIVTVACLRGNAAAGGVALAAACDVVIAGRGVVLNPAYRGMGLHGSEFHSYSYLTRCGPERASKMLREMIPQNTTLSRETGLVDIEIGQYDSSTSELEQLCIRQVQVILQGNASLLVDPSTTPFSCAPWCRPDSTSPYSHTTPLTTYLSTSKTNNYSSPHRQFPPLVHYRTEELSQMLLDSFHPTRSQRYHARRYAFIRKVKCGSTPTRYAIHSRDQGLVDEEEKDEFDDAEGWVRGEEWGWVGLEVPESLATSEMTKIDLYPLEVMRPGSPAMSIESSKAEYSDSTPASPSFEHYDIQSSSPSEPERVGLGSIVFPSDRSLSTVLGDGDTDSQGPKTPSTGGKANLNLGIYFSGNTRARESSNTLPLHEGRVVEVDYGNPTSTPSKVGRGKGERVMETPHSPSPKRAELGRGQAGYVKPTIGGLVQVEFPCLYGVGDGVGDDRADTRAGDV